METTVNKMLRMDIKELLIIQDKIAWILENDIFMVFAKINALEQDFKAKMLLFDSILILKKIKELGYLVVCNNPVENNLINIFRGDQKNNGIYYGFEFSKKNGLKKNFDGVSDEDYEIVFNILKGV
ncbi:MAG: hypothetical protein Q7S59_03885 [Sulfurimonas sp.]|nr:hypothetical protein [Sulfurimonas sp.]